MLLAGSSFLTDALYRLAEPSLGLLYHFPFQFMVIFNPLLPT